LAIGKNAEIVGRAKERKLKIIQSSQKELGMPLSSEVLPKEGQGWVLYDADCALCTRLIQRLAPLFSRCGLEALPLQTDWVKERLGCAGEEDRAALLQEMRILTAAGVIYGGAEAVLYLARQFWWSYPFFLLSYLPGIQFLLRCTYRWIAVNRHCSARGCALKR
jgi:predicted DCC family thiol-disulfide oxidoreductase YuxK